MLSSYTMLASFLTYLISNKAKSSAFITVAYCLFILPVTESLAFILPLTDQKQFIFSSIIKLLFSIILFSITYYALYFIEQLIRRNTFYTRWLKYSSLYFLIQLPLFILIYPGYWVWDELYVLRNAQVYSTEAWQNIFTNLYHTFCLYIIPTGVGIVVLQMVGASIVVGYLLSKLRETLHRPWLALIAGIPFLFIPILLNNLYPLRLTAYSYVEILILFQLLLLFLHKLHIRRPFLYFFWTSTFIVLLSFWRTEGIFFLVILPLLFFKLKLHAGFPRLSYQSCILILYILIIVSGSLFATRHTADPKYQLTSTINPLSMMLQYELKGDNLQEDLKAIDKVIAVKLLKDNPSYADIGALWKGPRPDFQNHMSEYYKAYFSIVKNNFDIFMTARLQTFAATNSLDSKFPPHIGTGTSPTDSELTYAFNHFHENNRFSQALNNDLKLSVTRFAILTNNNDELVQPFASIVWSIIPTIFLLSISIVYALWRKRFAWLLIFSLLLLQAVVIFFTTPANFFMYYIPVYITANFLLAMIFVIYLDNRLKFNKHT